MNKSSEVQLSRQETEIAFESLNSALVEHAKWLVDWNKHLICEVVLTEKFLSKHSFSLCAFGQWLHSENAQFLKHLFKFQEVDDLHNQVHQCVDIILNKKKQGEPFSLEQYDAYIEAEKKFSICIIALRDGLYRQMFSFDYLTGTLSRQAIFHVLEQEHARISRTNKTSCLVLMDLDFFKNINDKYGHQIGDEVLIFVAEYFTRHLRPYDSIGRYGGEEFLLCLPDSTPEETKNIMDRLREELNQQISFDQNMHLPTVSMGVAEILLDENIKLSLKHADNALYKAKELGRNRVEIWNRE